MENCSTYVTVCHYCKADFPCDRTLQVKQFSICFPCAVRLLEGVVQLAPLRIEHNAGVLHFNNLEYRLPRTELGVLSVLNDAYPKVVTQDRIARVVWNGTADDVLVRKCIQRLRAKVPGLNIYTERGYGYRLVVS